MNKELFKELIFLIFMFLVFSFFGWIWEFLFDFLKNGVISNHGVLHGPWLPIYGSGGVLIYIILKRFKDNPLIVFMGSFVICTMVEYITSWYLETYKHHKWWSYVNMPFNIDGRVCLLGSIFFGLGGLLGIYIFAPKIKSFMSKFNFRKLSVLTLTILAIFIIDSIYSGKHPNIVKNHKVIKIIDYENLKNL